VLAAVVSNTESDAVPSSSGLLWWNGTPHGYHVGPGGCPVICMRMWRVCADVCISPAGTKDSCTEVGAGIGGLQVDDLLRVQSSGWGLASTAGRTLQELIPCLSSNMFPERRGPLSFGVSGAGRRSKSTESKGSDSDAEDGFQHKGLWGEVPSPQRSVRFNQTDSSE